jgi:hypothetical protein
MPVRTRQAAMNTAAMLIQIMVFLDKDASFPALRVAVQDRFRPASPHVTPGCANPPHYTATEHGAIHNREGHNMLLPYGRHAGAALEDLFLWSFRYRISHVSK